MKFRAAYGYDAKAASDDAANIGDYGDSMTIQSQAEDADINVMMKRMRITGQMPENIRLPAYGDFTGISDYRSAIEAVRAADNDFLALPAEVRAKFDNDPQKLLAAVHTPGNEQMLKDLGLMKAVIPDKVTKVEVINTVPK